MTISIHGVRVALALSLCAAAGACFAAGPRVEYYPEAAYAGEPVVFVVRPAAGGGGELRAVGDGELGRWPGDGQSHEARLRLPASGELRFEQGAAAVVFRLAAPDGSFPLREREGYLYAGDLPAILAPEHRAPPKHDRRWETVRLVAGEFTDLRPRVCSGLIVAPGAAESNTLSRLTAEAGNGPREAWRWAGVGQGAWRVNALVIASGALPAADVLVLVPPLEDFDRGISDQDYLLKLEWVLQNLDARRYPHRFLVLPDEAAHAAHADRLSPALRMAALSNSYVWVGKEPADGESAPAAASWEARLAAAMERRVVWK